MPVKVAVQHHLVLLVTASYQLLREVNGRVKQFGRIWPSAIEVTANHRCSVMPVDHSIWIEHRYDFKNKGVSKQLRSLVVFLKQKFHRALNQELGVRFPWVYPGSQHDNLFIRFIPRLEFLIRCDVSRVGFKPFEINILKVYICRFYVSCNCQAVARLP